MHSNFAHIVNILYRYSTVPVPYRIKKYDQYEERTYGTNGRYGTVRKEWMLIYFLQIPKMYVRYRYVSIPEWILILFYVVLYEKNWSVLFLRPFFFVQIRFSFRFYSDFFDQNSFSIRDFPTSQLLIFYSIYIFGYIVGSYIFRIFYQ